jgi:hypothetical protein
MGKYEMRTDPLGNIAWAEEIVNNDNLEDTTAYHPSVVEQ